MENQTKPMRILQLNSGSGIYGGVSAFLFQVYQHIDHEKVQFDFASPNLTTYGIRRDTIEAEGGQVLEWHITGNVLVKKIKLYRKLKQFIREHHYDVVHINSGNFAFIYFAVSAAQKAGAKVRIVHSHNAGDLNHHGARDVFFRLLKGSMEKKATHLFACSKAAGRYLFSEEANARGDVKVIHNGIDIENYRYQPALRQVMREQLGLGDHYVVGHAGRFMEQKNHRYLIEIFAAIHKKDPNALLLLYGTGELEDDIKALVRERGLSEVVRFMGQSPEMAKAYQAMDIFLLPSFYEGLPVTGVEVQAAGLPMVLSDSITDEVKMTEPVTFMSLQQSPVAWADAVLAYRTHERRDGTEALTAAGYNMAKVAEELQAFYLSL